MTVDCFLDTNVLVYTAAGRHDEETKRKQAVPLIEHEDFGISAKVLLEFYVIVVGKIKKPLSPDDALE